MRNKGALILLILGLLLMGIYFSLFGFSYNTPTRIGQYCGIGAIVFFIIDETFKQG